MLAEPLSPSYLCSSGRLRAPLPARSGPDIHLTSKGKQDSSHPRGFGRSYSEPVRWQLDSECLVELAVSTFICVAGKWALGSREHHLWGTSRAVDGQGSAVSGCSLCAWLTTQEDTVQQPSSGVEQVSPVLLKGSVLPASCVFPKAACLCPCLQLAPCQSFPSVRWGQGMKVWGCSTAPLPAFSWCLWKDCQGNLAFLACGGGASGQEWDLCSLSHCG